MYREKMRPVNSEELYLRKIAKTGRNKIMSLLNFSLNISHFHIDIQVKKDEEKRKEKMRRLVEHEQRLNEVLEERNKFEYALMRINMQ
ncbi:hypothetical protein AN619_03760 [Thermotalea metallivorans]|uniref:Uncharacterized protein n=2 Tax=Thermotalea metallivorans TaxID=520762 RepID=A0A140LB49_9FIRM|nr:hypothetical protein AN619_03760 [Thermotalea metallivorans]